MDTSIITGNPLDEYPAVRRVGYRIQWLVNLVLGVTAIVLTSLGESPLWFVITTGAFNFVWSYTGLTADKNTPSVELGEHSPYDERGTVDTVTALLIVIVVVVLLLLFGVRV